MTLSPEQSSILNAIDQGYYSPISIAKFLNKTPDQIRKSIFGLIKLNLIKIDRKNSVRQFKQRMIENQNDSNH